MGWQPPLLGHPQDWALLCTHTRIHVHTHFCDPPPPSCPYMSALPVPGWFLQGGWRKYGSYRPRTSSVGRRGHHWSCLPLLGQRAAVSWGCVCRLQPPATLWACVWSSLPLQFWLPGLEQPADPASAPARACVKGGTNHIAGLMLLPRAGAAPPPCPSRTASSLSWVRPELRRPSSHIWSWG